jgi:hypothetical protein
MVCLGGVAAVFVQARPILHAIWGAASYEPKSLLQCISNLNVEVLTTYLLPKLVQQGSAAAVALTCTQLRSLCQFSIQHLDLSQQLQQDNPCHDPKLARQLVAAFPNCTSLYLTWGRSSVVGAYSGIHPLLAG